jgi:hypothetical protein
MKNRSTTADELVLDLQRVVPGAKALVFMPDGHMSNRRIMATGGLPINGNLSPEKLVTMAEELLLGPKRQL